MKGADAMLYANEVDTILESFANNLLDEIDGPDMKPFVNRFARGTNVQLRTETVAHGIEHGTAFDAGASFTHAHADILCTIHPVGANCLDAHHLHGHTFFELIYVYRGSCTQYLPDKTMTLNAGSFCLLSTSAEHGIAIASKENIVFNILISPTFFTRIFQCLVPHESMLNNFFWESIFGNEGKTYIAFEPNPGSRAEQFINSLLVEYIEPQPGFNQAMSSYLSLLFTELMRSHIYNVDSQSGNQLSIMDIIDYIDEHLASITLADLADAFHYSTGYIARLIKRFSHRTFSELVSEIRLNHAAELLERTDLSIENIAQELGFYDSSHFNRAFKKRFGLNPSVYRAAYGPHASTLPSMMGPDA